MRTTKWTFALLYVILFADKFFPTHGESDVPIWSDQVETQLQVIPLEASEIIEVKIFFDKKINALAISISDEETVGEKQLIYRSNSIEGISIFGHECNPAEIGITENSDFPFLESTPDGKRLKDFGFYFFFDPVNHAKQVSYDWNRTYGFETVKWESLNVNVNMFSLTVCNLTHYIRIEESDGMHYNNFVKIEATCDIYQESSEETFSCVNFVVDFFNFKNFISNVEVFQQPPGVYCPFLNETRDFPMLPPYFSFDFETFDSDNKLDDHVSTINFQRKVWYDSLNKLIRKDSLDKNLDVTVTMIGDYNSRLAYIILPTGECSVNELQASDTMKNGILLPGENFPLFPEPSDYPPQYVGQRKRFGITFDVWTKRNKHEEVNEISDYYFTSNLLTEDNANKTSPAFIELFIFDSDERLVGSALQIINEYRTTPSKQYQSTFDVTRCFPESNKTRFSLTFAGKNGKSFEALDEQQFKNDAQEKLLSLLRVNRMRLGAVEIDFLNETSVILSSVLIEDPTTLGYEKGKKETSREKALKHLSEVVSELKFVISLNTSAVDVSLTAVKLTLPYLQEDSDSKDGNKDTTKHKPNGFSSATLAAVGIVMLLIGSIQGVTLLVAYIRYRRSDPLVRKLTRSEENEQPKPQ